MNDYTQEEIFDKCKKIYSETREFLPIKELDRERWGFEILMGPPFKDTPLLFIGLQPGDWELTPREAADEGYENWWVRDIPHYVDAAWPLAQRIRGIFSNKNEFYLSRCVGLNAIYVRARNYNEYVNGIPSIQRDEIESFSMKANQNIVNLVNPGKIVVIGFATMSIFDPAAEASVMGVNGRTLVRRGKVFGRDSIAVLHLTGCHISNKDREIIKCAMLKYITE